MYYIILSFKATSVLDPKHSHNSQKLLPQLHLLGQLRNAKTATVEFLKLLLRQTFTRKTIRHRQEQVVTTWCQVSTITWMYNNLTINFRLFDVNGLALSRWNKNLLHLPKAYRFYAIASFRRSNY